MGVPNEAFAEIADPSREAGGISSQVCPEACEADTGRSQYQHHAEQCEIEQINYHQRKKRSVIAKISLILRNHPTGESEMERPGRTDDGIKQSPVGLHVIKKTKRAVDGDRENAVDREKIRRERDPEVGSVGDNMSAFTTNVKSANPAAHQPNPKRVGQFMTEDIKQDRAWQTDERDQPQQRA